MKTTIVPRPFIKWVGGKTSLLPKLKRHFPSTWKTYWEPFLGGGAVFFGYTANISGAVLLDTNPRLIEAYHQLKENPQAIATRLVENLLEYESLDPLNRKIMYYEVRDRFNSGVLTHLDRAIALMFLNKTGFNGLYRENLSGKLNTPIGSYKTFSVDVENLQACSRALQSCTIECADFLKSDWINQIGEDDFVYLDPPYDAVSATSKFTSYTKNGFGEKEQRELADIYRKICDKGANACLSNADTPLIRALYDDFKVVRLTTIRRINCKGQKRKPIQELLVLPRRK